MKQLSTSALVLVLLTACSQAQHLSASRSPKPTSGVSAPSPSTDVSSPSRTTGPASTAPSPLAPVLLHAQCRLPVFWWETETSAQFHAGFVTFPGGQLLVDASAPVPDPTLFYDRAFARWLVAFRDQVSPDGRKYAYAEGNPVAAARVPGKLHVVDVTTGTDRVIYNSPQVPTVVQFTAEGIYFTHDFGEGERNGLWLISPQGGQPRLISSTIWEPVVANGAAWGLTFNAADPHPAQGGLTHPYNTIVRFDLNTGASEVWWYQPGKDMRLLDGDYSGDLFAETFDEAVQNSLADWMLDSHGTAHPIGSANLNQLAAVDANGVWFDAWPERPASLWLMTNGQLEKVATFNVAAISVAGGCIPGP